jgi:hypothetical protein
VNLNATLIGKLIAKPIIRGVNFASVDGDAKVRLGGMTEMEVHLSGSSHGREVVNVNEKSRDSNVLAIGPAYILRLDIDTFTRADKTGRAAATAQALFQGTAQIAVEISFKVGAADRGFSRSLLGPGWVSTATETITTILITAVVQWDSESVAG